MNDWAKAQRDQTHFSILFHQVYHRNKLESKFAVEMLGQAYHTALASQTSAALQGSAWGLAPTQSSQTEVQG